MSGTFEGYERQYCELSTNLNKRCNSVIANEEERKRKFDELKSGLVQAESLIRRMDLEARTLPPTQKATLLAKLREYKSGLNTLKREPGTEQKRLMMTTEKLNQSGERIKESRRQLIETEDLGVHILQGLQLQHQTLLHAQQTMHGMDDNLAKSRRMLSSMSRRMERHKYTLGAIIAVLLFAIAFILYIQSRKSKT